MVRERPGEYGRVALETNDSGAGRARVRPRSRCAPLVPTRRDASPGGQRGTVVNGGKLVANGRGVQTDATWASQGGFGGFGPHGLAHRGPAVGETVASGMG